MAPTRDSDERRCRGLDGGIADARTYGAAHLAAWQSIDRLIHQQPLHNLWWVLAAGVIGFIGNEAVAIYRIRVGRKNLLIRTVTTDASSAPHTC